MTYHYADLERELAEIDKRVAVLQEGYNMMYEGHCLDIGTQVNLLCARLLLAHLKRLEPCGGTAA